MGLFLDDSLAHAHWVTDT